MEALSTKTLELRASESGAPSRHRLFYGDYGYYLDRLAREAENGSEPNEAPKPAPPPSAAATAPEPGETAANAGAGTGTNTGLPKTILLKANDPGSADFLSASERRELEKQKQARLRRLQRQEEEILRELEDLEEEKARLETELGKPEVYSNGEKAKTVKLALDETSAAVEAKTKEWEEKAAEMDEAIPF
jgi:ATP-binding cassette subfamily F protein 3